MNYSLYGRQKKNRRKHRLNREIYSYARWTVLIEDKLRLMKNAREAAMANGMTQKKYRRRKVEGMCIKRAHKLSGVQTVHTDRGGIT